MACECPCPTPSLSIEQAALQIHVYQPTDADAFEELTSGSGRGDDDQIMAASACELPSMSWEGLWESLIYSDDIKSKLLDYIYATVVFSDADVDCKCCGGYSDFFYILILLPNSQSMSCHGTALYFCTGHPVLARHPYVAPLHRSCRSGCPTGL